MKNDLQKIDEKIQRLTAMKKAIEKRTIEQARKRRNHLLISFSVFLLQGRTSAGDLEAAHAWITKEKDACEKIRQFIFKHAFPSSGTSGDEKENEGDESHETD